MVRNLQKFLDGFYKEDGKGRTNADKQMSSLNLKQLGELIDLEVAGRKSPTVLKRLHRRLTRVRADEERRRLERNRKDWRA